MPSPRRRGLSPEDLLDDLNEAEALQAAAFATAHVRGRSDPETDSLVRRILIESLMHATVQEADHMTAESPLCAYCRQPMRDGGVPLLSDHHGNPRHHGHADCWRMASMFPGMV